MSNKELNTEQKNAVEYFDGPLIIVAGAGTGKTTVITEKIKHIIDKEMARPEEILALTFNEKAAAEMVGRIDEILDIGYSDMHISTFHAFCEKILRKFALDLGLPNRFKILTQTDAWLLIRKHLDKFNLDYYKPLGNPTRHIHELIRHFSKCKDELVSPSDYLEYAEGIELDKDAIEAGEQDRLSEIANAYHVYNQLLLDNGALDFGDLIFYANELFDKRPSILKQMQKDFKYILVDEFQDVNWAQYQLIKKISSGGGHLTVVGDDDQSIYAFRGASISNILRFKDDFTEAREIVLNKNYRSTQEILDKSYEVIQNNNPYRLESKLNIDKKLHSEIREINITDSVIHAHFSSINDEARFVANEIEKIYSGDPDISWDDFAVLVRANNHAEAFANMFEKSGLPYEFMAATGLFRQPLIMDCINFLKVVDSYHESHGVYRLLNIPFFNINPEELHNIIYFAEKKSISYYEALKKCEGINISDTTKAVIRKLLSMIQEGMINAKKDKPTAVLYKFLESSGYLKYLAEGETDSNRAVIRQISHLNQFFEYIDNYESMTSGANVADFLDHFNQVVDAGDYGIIKQPKDTPDSINICTIHMAKGLEFKYVFIVNLVEERFPVRRKGEGIEVPSALIKEVLPEDDAHYSEERRLFYVAMTRAKNLLYLTSADNYGGVREKKISRFLTEINFNKTAKKNSEVKFEEVKVMHAITEKNEFKYDIPKSFSFSQIQKYEKCPYQYKLGSIVKLPTRGKPSLSFGLTMHNTLEKFYTKIQELNSVRQDSLFKANQQVDKKPEDIVVPTIDELRNIYEESWIPDWFEDSSQRQACYEKGKQVLKEFYKANENNWTVPIALETGFSIKVGENTIKGRIDRIDLNKEGRLEIIDYKTGASKEKIVGEEKDQLLIYQLALEQLVDFKDLGSSKILTYYYLTDNSRVSFLGTEKDLKKITEKIDVLVKRIESMDFKPKPEKFNCEHCDFKDICDYRAI